ncbi:hypothetical protein FA95DRAFT_1572974 [Auriscalpium vulgare]|uniref:Uncharacterized protein n=1 Tax=Auriscalpium vulgare TaxID=40419 RepID=A0ACB8RSY9_9AGAM|nr:hypothetical protein FA95DRAFT_1572974 [Auriscalpium vulgare]
MPNSQDRSHPTSFKTMIFGKPLGPKGEILKENKGRKHYNENGNGVLYNQWTGTVWRVYLEPDTPAYDCLFRPVVTTDSDTLDYTRYAGLPVHLFRNTDEEIEKLLDILMSDPSGQALVDAVEPGPFSVTQTVDDSQTPRYRIDADPYLDMPTLPSPETQADPQLLSGRVVYIIDADRVHMTTLSRLADSDSVFRAEAVSNTNRIRWFERLDQEPALVIVWPNHLQRGGASLDALLRVINDVDKQFVSEIEKNIGRLASLICISDCDQCYLAGTFHKWAQAPGGFFDYSRSCAEKLDEATSSGSAIGEPPWDDLDAYYNFVNSCRLLGSHGSLSVALVHFVLYVGMVQVSVDSEAGGAVTFEIRDSDIPRLDPPEFGCTDGDLNTPCYASENPPTWICHKQDRQRVRALIALQRKRLVNLDWSQEFELTSPKKLVSVFAILRLVASKDLFLYQEWLRDLRECIFAVASDKAAGLGGDIVLLKTWNACVAQISKYDHVYNEDDLKKQPSKSEELLHWEECDAKGPGAPAPFRPFT